MKQFRYKKYVLFMICLTLFCIFDGRNSVMAQSVKSKEGNVTSNAGNEDYLTCSSTMFSYLYENKDGTVTRVECDNQKIIIESYDSSFQLVKTYTIGKELEIFGGFYSDQDANYIVFGQQNMKEDPNVEVYRVVKYSKDWKRLNSCGLSNCNTTIPFRAGSLRFDKAGTMLYIRTCHQMYQEPDGRYHQANLTMSVDTIGMTITDSYYIVRNIGKGYVSHSFNQFIRVDGNVLLAVDHGDAYPRSIVLIKYDQPAGQTRFTGTCSHVNVLTFPGEIGDNYTGGSVGGFEVSNHAYLTAGNYANRSSKEWNVFLGVIPKDDFSDAGVKIKYFTDYTSDRTTSTPQLVKIKEDQFMMMWEEHNLCTEDAKENADYRVAYVCVNQDGEQLTKVRRIKGRLSDCQPILYHETVLWYYTDQSTPVFCSVPADGSAVKK